MTIETNSNEFENNDSFQESFEEKLKEADIDYVNFCIFFFLKFLTIVC